VLPGLGTTFAGLVPTSGGGAIRREELASLVACRCPFRRTGTPAFAGLGARCSKALCPKAAEGELAVGLARLSSSEPDLVSRDRPVVHGWAPHSWALCSRRAEPGMRPDSLLPDRVPVPASRPNACVHQAGHCARRPRAGLLQTRGVVVRLASRPPFGAQPARRSARFEGWVPQLGGLVPRSGGAEARKASLLSNLATVPCLDRSLRRARFRSLVGLVPARLRRLDSRFEGLALRWGLTGGP